MFICRINGCHQWKVNLWIDLSAHNYQKSLVIRHKSKFQNECDKKTKPTKFSENEHLLLPDTHFYVCTSAGNKCSFFGKFVVLSCNARFEIHPFALLPTKYGQRKERTFSLWSNAGWEAQIKKLGKRMQMSFQCCSSWLWTVCFLSGNTVKIKCWNWDMKM